MRLKCFVIDDIPSTIRLIKKYTEQTPLASFVGGETNANKAKDLLLEGKIVADLIFLDIEMPGISGLELLRPLSKIATVILISGHQTFGEQAFAMGASGYLYKPITLEKFQDTVMRVFDHTRSNTVLATNSPPAFYYIPGEGREVRVRLKTEDIWYIESTVNFTVVQLIDKSCHICYLNLKQLSALLPPPHFIRINRSIIVSTSKIMRYDAYDVYLEDDKQFSFGDSYRQEFIRLIRQHGMLY